MANPDSVDSVVTTDHPTKAVDHRQRGRLTAAAIIGAVVAAFAIVNLDNVKIHWIVTTGHVPLILIVALAFLLGMAVDRLLVVRAKRRSKTVTDEP
jgi:uncharacterized integral membrane protein